MMYITKYSLVFCAFLFNLKCNSQNQNSFSKYFNKVKLDCDFINTPKSSYYKIEFIKEGKSFIPCSYFFNFSEYNEQEKIKMVQELLTYEGDTSLCAVKVNCYNPQRSQTVPEGVKYYSIQVEALFIINHIILVHPYSYSAFPIIRDIGAKNVETISGELIKEAFTLYKNWLEEVKKIGINRAIQRKILPLNDKSSVFWY